MWSAGRIAEAMTSTLAREPEPRTRGICLFGSWDGGRRGENWYTLAGVSTERDALKLRFTDGHELPIFGPDDLGYFKYAITVRVADHFVFRDPGGEGQEVRPPQGWPPHPAALAFEFAV